MNAARQVRAGADEPAEVSCSVNGTPVTIQVPPRLTLADALRDRLGLTGTHLGCEHGVCGMCTVLVDGAAARSCLLFACQLDGSEIVTVEGLGTPDDMHPLQEAFSRRHALQCGFCTPGFLVSGYDLLAHRPGIDAGELPAELSGVLCRCTGYRNIVAAVAEVARRYPHGIPGPRNCAPRGGMRALAARAGGAPGAAPGPAWQNGQNQQNGQAGGPGRTTGTGEPAPPAEVVLPGGEPTVRVEVTQLLAAAADQVWAVLADTSLTARCLPGAELTEDLGGDRYRGRVRVSLGPIRLSFAGIADVTQRDQAARRIRVLAQGADAGGGQARADIRLLAVPAGPTVPGGPAGPAGPAGPGAERTRLTAEAAVYLTGRVAQFGRALAGDVSRRIFEQFASAVERAAASGAAPEEGGGAGALGLAARAATQAAAARLRARLREILRETLRARLAAVRRARLPRRFR
jgi:aerobic-type carbon monoxide dehydrogenase small subunit (CoxS/CutS family)/carbon monoxide dehydrogenase subunit G